MRILVHLPQPSNEYPMSQPMRGALILEAVSPQCPWAVRLAVAFAARMLVDLGAHVVKLVDADDSLRLDQTAPDELADPAYGFLNAGKSLVILPGGSTGPSWGRLQRRALVSILDNGLAASAQLVPGRSTQAVLSMFGKDDAGATAASEFTLMAAGGLLDLVGEADRQPLALGGHPLAYSAGLAAFAGVLAALATTTGGSSVETVRVNLLDTAVWLNWKSVVAAAHTGAAPTRSGKNSEWRVIPCADGWVALVFRDSDWPKLKALVGDPQLDADCFATHFGRRTHAGELARVMDTAFLHMRRREIHERALACRIPLGPVYSPQDLMDDPQYLERHFLQRAAVQPRRDMLIPRLPVLWNGASRMPGALPRRSDAATRMDQFA